MAALAETTGARIGSGGYAGERVNRCSPGKRIVVLFTTRYVDPH